MRKDKHLVKQTADLIIPILGLLANLRRVYNKCMDQPAENALGRQEQQEVKRKFPLVLVVFAFVIFPPISFILMWLDPTYHKNLKIFLFVFGFLFLIQTVFLFFSLQKLIVVYQDLDLQTPSTIFSNIILLLSAAYGVFQIIYGFFYRNLTNTKVAIAAISLIFGTIIIAILLGLATFLAILPIYSITTAF